MQQKHCIMLKLNNKQYKLFLEDIKAVELCP